MMASCSLSLAPSLAVRGDCGASMTCACPQSHQTVFIRATCCARRGFFLTFALWCMTWASKGMICWGMMVLQNGQVCLPALDLQLFLRQPEGPIDRIMQITLETMYRPKDEPDAESVDSYVGHYVQCTIDGPRSDFQMLHASHARLGSVWDSTRLRKHFHTQRPVPVPKQATYAARAAQSGYRRGFRMGRDSVCTAYSPYKSLRTLAGCHDSMYDAKEYQHCKIVDPSLQA